MCADSTKYGPNCTQECLCVNGACDGDIHGNGSCDCYSNYTGVFCDELISGCENVTCQNNSRCQEIDGNTTCICEAGYESSENGSCIPINACVSSPCLQFATCLSTGPSQYQCACRSGYLGDGKVCEAINPCRINHGGCVTNSSTCMYMAPNVSQCDCITGYENYQPQVGCSLTDVCKLKPNQCHTNATCLTVRPGEFTCTCNAGLVGDGTECYGNILQRLVDLNENHPVLKYQLNFAIEMIQTVYKEPFTKHGPFTVFIANDRGFKSIVRAGSFDSFLKNEDKARQVLRQHMIIGQLSLEKLQNHTFFYTLQGVPAELIFKMRNDVFKYRIHGSGNKAKIIEGNIVAANGIIHVTNSLLTSQPNAVGDITYLRMEVVFKSSNITVFVPSNRVWDSLPEGTLEFLQSNEGKTKLKVILENHVFHGKIPVADLINMKRIHSLAGYSASISITDVGQIQLNGNVNISQTDIPFRGGLYYHIDSVLAPPEMGGILPNRCDLKTSRPVRGSCSVCHGKLICPGPNDVPMAQVTRGCRYWVTIGGQYVAHIGCARMCTRTYTTRRCCDGFFGIDCLPCPGGFKKPCNKHGMCNDGYYGNGTCSCDDNFMGRSCDRCSQKNMFGPYCNQTCTCLHGTCNEDTGVCKAHSCEKQFFGINCDQKLTKCGQATTLCHAFATCYEDGDEFRCQCPPGYDGDGLSCTEIDPCLKPDRGGCHIQATCTKVGPDMPRCTCDKGWVGDGFTCYPATPCMNRNHCHNKAVCRSAEAGKSNCICIEGYFGNGTYCRPTNSCIEDNGGCHMKALCIPDGPGDNNCSCLSGYEGDGYSCYSSIGQEVSDNPSLSELAGLLKLIDPRDNFLMYLSDNYTFFAPTDEAMSQFLSQMSKDYWTKAENILTLLRFHTLEGLYQTDDLLKLETSYGKFDTMYDGYSIRVVINNQSVLVFSSQTTTSRVISPDNFALNGFIHIVDKVLEPLIPEDELPELHDFFTTHSDYSLFSQWLSKKGLIDELENMEEYTLFAPNNQAMLKINRTVTKDFLKYYIIPKILLSPAIIDGQTEDSILGTKHQIQFQVRNGQVYVNGIVIADPDQLTAGGIIQGVSDLLHPVLNKCEKTLTNRTYGPCISCISTVYLCPEGFYATSPPVFLKNRCTYSATGRDGHLYTFLGCYGLCEIITKHEDCCAGHFGTECKECPGGPEVPCSGRGVCNEGINGTGICVCDEHFWGLSCDRCTRDWVGPDCNISRYSCDFQNGNCSEHATCEMVEDEITCRCHPGYLGDGKVCHSPCDYHNGGCHDNASCTFQQQSLSCKCLSGYHGNGSWCKPVVDLCFSKTTICSPYAICSFSPPNVTDESDGKISCECLQGFVGNGSICNKDILKALSNLPVTAAFYQVILSLDDDGSIRKLLGDLEENTTIFVPVNIGTTEIQHLSYLDVMNHIVNNTDIYINTSLVFNTSFVSDVGKTLLITYSEEQFWVNDIRITDINIPALNGYIHLIEAPLWYNKIPKEGSSTKSKLPVIIGPIVGVLLFLVICVIAITVFVYWRSDKTGFMDVLDRFRKGSEGSLLFSRLSNSQEDEDEEPLPNPFTLSDFNFENPIFTNPQQAPQ
ncbi:stabilin-2-like [Gigantopelta aegis]|uniref:stabilin-2-like n=1 Tax=Gigantopelta aegis TaxID=1735272 RepID=UPI001B88CB80|nr:stabilin-2-like [Gigantopelta aegis]